MNFDLSSFFVVNFESMGEDADEQANNVSVEFINVNINGPTRAFKAGGKWMSTLNLMETSGMLK